MENSERKGQKPLIRTLLAVLVVGALALGGIALTTQVVQAEDETSTQTQPSIGGFRGSERMGRFGFGAGIDYNALLAEALGISVEELQAAYEKADAAALEQAVTKGNLSAEQAELIKAQRALMKSIDMDSLQAKALGISVEELQAAREEGKSMPELMEELGLEPEAVREALQAAFEEAVQQAVEDGIITQEQADLILNSGMRIPWLGMPGMGGRGHRPGGPGMFPSAPLPESESSQGSGL